MREIIWLNERLYKVYIWGTGSAFNKLIKDCNFGYEAIIDSNTSKIGDILNGKKVYGVSHLKSLDFSETIIIVASSFFEEIFNTLVNMKFPVSNIINYEYLLDYYKKKRLIDHYEKCELKGPQDEWLKSHKDFYKGEKCIIIGNGPSLNDVPSEIFEKYITFGVNGIFKKHIPNFYCTISNIFYKDYIDEIINLKCTRKFINADLLEVITYSENESILKCAWPIQGIVNKELIQSPLKFSDNPERLIYLGGTVLFVCLQLAYYMGFSEVYIVGADNDFGELNNQEIYGGIYYTVEDEDKYHFSKEYFKKGTDLHLDMLSINRSFELAKQKFEENGRKIFILSENSRIRGIEKKKFEEILN